MPHPARRQRAQHRRIGVALHGVQHIARKRLDKGARGRGHDGRAQAMDRLLRPVGGDDLIDRRAANG